MTLNASIFIDYNKDLRLSFDKEEKYIVSDYEQNVYKESTRQGSSKSIFDFCSESNKFVIILSFSFFHFYTEHFAKLLLMYKKDPSLEVIVVVPLFNGKEVIEDLLKKDEVKMFFLFLIDNNISYKIVNIRDIHNAKITNSFFYQFNASDSINQANLLSDMSKEYVKKQSVVNKAYIHTNRVKDEQLLEEFLQSFGFDIIRHNHFENFIDQMNYYYNCKILISATSGGLVNSCFMDDKSLVIELVTTVPQLVDNTIKTEEVHHIYDTLSLQKNHTYIALSNIHRTAKDIIEDFKNNRFLIVALEQENE